MLILWSGQFTIGFIMTSSPSNFILNSDFATLKNSERGLTATITVTASKFIVANSYWEQHVDIPITEAYAVSTARISSSRNSNRYLSCNYLDMVYMDGYTDSAGDWIVTYNVEAFIFRLSSNVVRFQIYIRNPYGEILVTDGTAETFSLYMNTFVPPLA